MTERLLLGVLVVTLMLAIVLLASVPAIHRWERQQGYPYGKLCQMYGTCT